MDTNLSLGQVLLYIPVAIACLFVLLDKEK